MKDIPVEIVLLSCESADPATEHDLPGMGKNAASSKGASREPTAPAASLSTELKKIGDRNLKVAGYRGETEVWGCLLYPEFSNTTVIGAEKVRLRDAKAVYG